MPSGIHDEKELQQFDRWGVARPEHAPHGTDEDIREKMVQLLPTEWRQEGNKLIGETEMGTLVHFLPTTHILTHTNEKGHPVFKVVDET